MEKDNTNPPIKVLLTAPYPALQEGLKVLIESENTVQVTAISASPEEWGSHLPEWTVNVVVPIGKFSSAWAQNIIDKSKGKPVLFLLTQTMAEIPPMDRGVWGVISYSATAKEIILAIQAVSNGFVLLSPLIMSTFNPTGRRVDKTEAQEMTEPLTDREIEVLQYLAQGFTNKEIAAELSISFQTVKFHVSSIFSKMGVTNRTEAVSNGLRLGLVTL